MSAPTISLRDRAEFFHRQLPQTIRHHLNSRGIPDTLIERYTLGWNGKAITIPVLNRQGEISFIKRAKPPVDGSRALEMETSPSVSPELFGWQALERLPNRVVIAANEFDSLVLEARGFPAVCSAAGVDAFEAEWARHFEGIDHVYVCFDRDPSSDEAAERVDALIPKAKVVHLPEAVGMGGGVTEFFVRLAKRRRDFEELLLGAEGDPSGEVADTPPTVTRFLKRAERLIAEVPITRVIGQYTTLERSAEHLVGRCPLHEEAKPTLRVYPEAKSFHCFGCGAGGDAITFMEKKFNLTLGQALEALERIRYADNFPHVA